MKNNEVPELLSDSKKERGDSSLVRKKLLKNAEIEEFPDEKAREKNVFLPERKAHHPTNHFIQNSVEFESILNEKTLNEDNGKFNFNKK